MSTADVGFLCVLFIVIVAFALATARLFSDRRGKEQTNLPEDTHERTTTP